MKTWGLLLVESHQLHREGKHNVTDGHCASHLSLFLSPLIVWQFCVWSLLKLNQKCSFPASVIELVTYQRASYEKIDYLF